MKERVDGLQGAGFWFPIVGYDTKKGLYEKLFVNVK